MKKAALIVDNYKVKFFASGLKKAGYTFTKYSGPTAGVTTFKVEVDAGDADKMRLLGETLQLIETKLHRPKQIH